MQSSQETIGRKTKRIAEYRMTLKGRNCAKGSPFLLRIEYTMGPCPLLAVFILLRFSGIYPVLAALPDLVVHVKPTALSRSDSLTAKSDDNDAFIEIYAKRAQFGSRDRFLEGILVRPPDYDSFLCNRYRKNMDLPSYSKPDEKNSTVMLVPRGECSFESKAYAAKHFYGAKAIMIYDRLGARYTWNASTQRVNFPQAILDYECGNGNAVMRNLPLDPPAYNAAQLDPLMGMAIGEGSNAGIDVGMTNICNLTNTAFKPCESQLCLVTSHSENSTDYNVCCAWDTPVTMPAADDAKDLDTNDILTVWLTIRQSERIFQSDLLSFENDVSIEARGNHSAFNVTYIFMWIWGTLVMMVGALYAAGDYRRFGSKLSAYKVSEEKNETRHRDLRRRPRPRRTNSGQPNENSMGEKEKPAGLEKNRITKNKRGKLNFGGSQADLESGEHSFQDEMDEGIVDKDPEPTIRIGKKQKKQTNKEKPRKSKQNEKVVSLHSLPPPERKRKQKRPRSNNNAQLGNNTLTNQSNTEEEVGNETSIIPAREAGTITPFEMTYWHVLGK